MRFGSVAIVFSTALYREKTFVSVDSLKKEPTISQHHCVRCYAGVWLRCRDGSGIRLQAFQLVAFLYVWGLIAS